MLCDPGSESQLAGRERQSSATIKIQIKKNNKIGRPSNLKQGVIT